MAQGIVSEEVLSRVINLAIAIQQIPAPTFQELQRASYMHEIFRMNGLSEVSMDRLGNVYGLHPGIKSENPLVVSAHTDTVFPLQTDLSLKREPDEHWSEKISGPGIGDNSLGVAGLLGLFWMLKAQPVQPKGDIWFVANVGEEGLGDLCGMKAIVDRFGDRASAYLVLEGMALGQIYHRGLGVQRYRITIRTSGGHSWVDYGKPSAIHEIAELVCRLQALPIPVHPRTSINVGTIAGGTSINTIAAEAHLDLDLRSEDSETLTRLVKQVIELVRLANRADVVHAKAELIGQRPVGEIPAEHPLVRLASNSLQALGIQPNLNIGSTDANIPLSRGYPALTLGLTFGSGAHSANEYIYTRPVAQGLAYLVTICQNIFGMGK
jgi:acetylornithine deacetylase/succinyl-diaminopimelate desuccinylase-like protein